MHQSVVVESAPSSYFTSNHHSSSLSSTISLSNGEIVNYNDFDNYTMRTIQQKIIETSSTSANSSLVNNKNTNNIKGGFSSTENQKSSRPDLSEGAGIYRQNTDLEARDSNGQPFRQNRSNKYGHVKSKVDSNLHNLSLRRLSGRKPHEEVSSTATADTKANKYSPSINQSLSSSFTSPSLNSSINHSKEMTASVSGKESRIQTGLNWRKPTILVGPSSTTHHHLKNGNLQHHNTNNRIRSLSASPNVQHAADPSPSSSTGKSLEPIKSDFSPLRSRSASMEYSLQPNDFDTYLQKSTSLMMANGVGNSGDSNSEQHNKSAKDSIRLYRSYIHKKRNPLPDMEDVFESRMKELEQRNAMPTTQQQQQQQQQQFPSVFETSTSKQTSKDNSHQQTAGDFVRVMPLIQPTLPRFDLSHAPSKKIARPISEHFTSSTDRRAHMSGDLPSINLQQRPASEYYQTSQSAVDMNNNNRLSFSLPDPRSSDLYHHQRHQDQHYQFRENYKDTFNYLKGDYLKEDEKRRALSLDSAQKKTDLSQSLSRQAGMILQRLQEQQQQREQQDDLQRRQLEEKNANEKEKLKEQRRLAVNSNEQKPQQKQQHQENHRQNTEEQQRRMQLEQQKRQQEHNLKRLHDEQGPKPQKRVDEQKKYHDQLGDQYRFYEHQRKLREQQEYQRASTFDKHHQQQQQQQISAAGDGFQTPALPPTPQNPFEGNDESNSSLRKAELSLAENIRFLKQLQSHNNKSLPPIPPPTNIFKSTTSSHSTSDQSPTTLPLTWGRQDTMDLLKHSKLHHTNNDNNHTNNNDSINASISNNNITRNTDLIGRPAPKKSALKKNRHGNALRGMAPSYFNYATSSYLSSSNSDLPKQPKKSVKIVLEKNSFHFYPKDIW